MKKRIAIIGKGTAGSQSIIHYLKHMQDYEIHWYFDESIPTQAVGEGSVLNMPRNLFYNLNFSYLDLDKIDATLKVGIYKSGWGKTGKDFLHSFSPPTVGLHFNAVALQNFIYGKIKDRVVIHNKNAYASDIDADYIMDCSGKPSSYEEFNKSSFIPVNSAYITQCYWEYPRFQYSLTIARPYGWVFGIPLKNRCSIGYLFNRNIDNIEAIKEDAKVIFKEYNLIPSENTNYLEFENYYRKKNYTDRVVYNGNKSFFLEPLEATSIALINLIQRNAFDLWNNAQTPQTLDNLNLTYIRNVSEIETMIMLHYFAGSVYDTEFWKFANEQGKKCIETAVKYDSKFIDIIKYVVETKHSNLCDSKLPDYGSWWAGSFCQNLQGLGIESILQDYLKVR